MDQFQCQQLMDFCGVILVSLEVALDQGLDAIAVTGHNEVVDAKVGRWFSRLIGGPIVLVGEEILSEPRYHLIAVGISTYVDFHQRAADAIDEIHRQGGVAIAAPIASAAMSSAHATGRIALTRPSTKRCPARPRCR